MNAPTRIMPEMRELNVSNHLLGDQTALAEAWDRDGYWFFRGVLDKEVIAGIRQVYVDYLVEMGLVDTSQSDLRYNGADFSHLPVNSNVTRLNERKVHRMLHEAPTINAFFATLFGCAPFWVPITVHRTNPPVTEPDQSRFDFIHEDGVYNEGLPFLICWVPIDDIDSEVGGIALVEDVHKGPCLHTKEGMKINPIRPEDVPAGHWRRSDYRMGDVLLMSLRTPHSGLANISPDRFRLSMDTRIMPSNGNVPVVGALAEVTTAGVRVAGDGGRLLWFEQCSFVRGLQGNQMPLAEVPDCYLAGDEVIVTLDGDRVVNMRPKS
jgi:1-deoxypentalenic acid 11beta-hydroxylase